MKFVINWLIGLMKLIEMLKKISFFKEKKLKSLKKMSIKIKFILNVLNEENKKMFIKEKLIFSKFSLIFV